MSRPHPNSYPVPGSPHFAGEYPYLRGDGGDGLEAILTAGVHAFVDLTEEDDLGFRGPLLPYAGELGKEGRTAEYIRLPIRDMGVPSLQRMREILDTLDRIEQDGRAAYVHCWGGIGRTGTVIACHLVRRGLDPDPALEQVGRLFATMSPDKVARHPEGSPQTDGQRAFVRAWAEHERERRATRDRVRGALVGLAVGDALGGAVEFMRPGSFTPLTDMVGGGPHALDPGEWTDDTSMALCLAASLSECGWDPADQMTRYVRWWRKGYLSSKGRCFDIGTTTRAALSAFERTGEPFSGSRQAHAAGNGSLMRLAPVPMYFRSDPAEAIRRAGESSRTTHGAAAAVDACRYFAALLLGAVAGEPKERLLQPFYSPVPGLWDDAPLCSEVAEVASGSFLRREPPQIRGTGYVVQSLEAALWAFARTESYREACLAAANLGDDADTTAAICGQLAGAYYGESAIPQAWRDVLALPEVIDRLAERLFDRPARPVH